MKTEIVKLNVDQYGLKENKAKELELMYKPMIAMLTAMEQEFNELVSQEITEDVEKDAKDLRIRISKIRIRANEAREKGKAEYLRGGKAIQGGYNTLCFAVVSKEEKLKEIENHSYNLGVEKLRILEGKRLEILQQYQPLTISDGRLGGMDADVWDNYINGVKLNFEQVKAAEAKAEKERIAAEKAELKRIADLEAENKKLEKESKRLAKIQEEKQKEFNELAKKEAELLDELKAEKQKLADELEAARVKEIKAKQAEEKAKQVELNKGDAEKVKDLINNLTDIQEVYEFDSDENKKMYSDVCGLIENVINHINK